MKDLNSYGVELTFWGWYHLNTSSKCRKNKILLMVRISSQSNQLTNKGIYLSCHIFCYIDLSNTPLKTNSWNPQQISRWMELVFFFLFLLFCDFQVASRLFCIQKTMCFFFWLWLSIFGSGPLPSWLFNKKQKNTNDSELIFLAEFLLELGPALSGFGTIILVAWVWPS